MARVPVGNGKYRTTSHMTKTAAAEAIDLLWSRRAKGGNIEVMTFGTVVSQWFEQGESLWKIKTIEDYRLAISKMESLTNVPVDFLQGDDLQSMLSEIKSLSMRKRVRKTFGTIMSWAVRRKYCTENPVSQTDPIRTQRAQVEVFEAEEIAAIFDHLHRLPLAVKLMYTLALRPGELWALEWGDWNRKKQTLQIKRNVKEVRGVLHIETPKTDSSRRILPLGKVVTEILTEQLAHAVKAGKTSRTDVMFPDSTGGHIRARNFQRNWKKALKDANVEYRKIYTIRHTTATLWLNSGVSLAAVSRWLGHANVTTTLRHYSHLMLDDLNEVKDFWDRRTG